MARAGESVLFAGRAPLALAGQLSREIGTGFAKLLERGIAA